MISSLIMKKSSIITLEDTEIVVHYQTSDFRIKKFSVDVGEKIVNYSVKENTIKYRDDSMEFLIIDLDRNKINFFRVNLTTEEIDLFTIFSLNGQYYNFDFFYYDSCLVLEYSLSMGRSEYELYHLGNDEVIDYSVLIVDSKDDVPEEIIFSKFKISLGRIADYPMLAPITDYIQRISDTTESSSVKRIIFTNEAESVSDYNIEEFYSRNKDKDSIKISNVILLNRFRLGVVNKEIEPFELTIEDFDNTKVSFMVGDKEIDERVNDLKIITQLDKFLIELI